MIPSPNTLAKSNLECTAKRPQQYGYPQTHYTTKKDPTEVGFSHRCDKGINSLMVLYDFVLVLIPDLLELVYAIAVNHVVHYGI